MTISILILISADCDELKLFFIMLVKVAGFGYN